jgi:chromosome partitioning protein
VARKIAVVIHKGGAGKTVSTRNIGAALALLGKRTLIVDLDEQANATQGFVYDPKTLAVTLNDLFKDPNLDPLKVLLGTQVENLHLLPAHENLSNTETGMALQRADPNAPDPIDTLKTLLIPLEQYYDFILFDTPPSVNYMTINALAAADEVIIPSAASSYNEQGLKKTWQTYERAKGSYNPKLKTPRILITRVKRTNASANVRASVDEGFREYVMEPTIAEVTTVDEAEQLHQLVVLYDPYGAASEGYKKVAEILANE